MVLFVLIFYVLVLIKKGIPGSIVYFVLFENYFVFYETTQQHQTVNSISSTYRFPTGSLLLPIYKTNSGKSTIRYICYNTWNLVLKDLSKINIEKYNRDPSWMNKTNINTFKHLLKKHFLEHY